MSHWEFMFADLPFQQAIEYNGTPSPPHSYWRYVSTRSASRVEFAPSLLDTRTGAVRPQFSALDQVTSVSRTRKDVALVTSSIDAPFV